MRAFLIFLLLIVAALVAGALLAYPGFELGQALGRHWSVHRVASRLSMLFLLIGFLFLIQRLNLANLDAFGYGLEKRRFLRLTAMWFAIGTLSMLPVIAILMALGIRTAGGDIGAASVASIVVSGLLTGLVVAATEETFLRGAMFTAVERESGPRTAIVLTALIYATLHFLNRVKIPNEQVSWGSGPDLLAGTLNTLSHPAAILDSFLALFAVGVLLALVRARTGNIAGCLGLHAGWVWVIAVTRELTQRDPASPWAPLVGSYDGIVGYFVFGWTLLMIVATYFILRRRGAPRAPPA